VEVVGALDRFATFDLDDEDAVVFAVVFNGFFDLDKAAADAFGQLGVSDAAEIDEFFEPFSRYNHWSSFRALIRPLSKTRTSLIWRASMTRRSMPPPQAKPRNSVGSRPAWFRTLG